MKPRDGAIVGVMFIAILLAGYFFMLSRALATTAPATTGSGSSIDTITKEVLPILSTLELNGPLPVQVAPEEVGNTSFFGAASTPAPSTPR